MAAAVYTTDLATLNLSTGTWGEFTGAASGSAPTENDSDNFIAGTDSTTEAVRNSGLSSMYAPSNTTTIASGDAVFMWLYFAAMPNMKTFANAGFSVAMGSAVGDYYKWPVVGRDTLPYGGWFSVAVDPSVSTNRAQIGSPSGTWTYFGSVIDLDTGIAKGNAFANDYQRHGRSLIVTVGDATTPGTFNGAALANDAVTTRWGLFAEIPGGYSQKGLFQLGSSGTAVYFDDTNINIVTEDTFQCAAGFNEFEILNSSSTVKLTGVQISSLGTVSPGIFTVTDNATVELTGCTFTDRGAFTFNAGTNANTILTSTFRRCGLVTTGGATLTGCTFDEPTGAVGVTASSPANAALISASAFNSDGTGNGLEITGTAANMTLTDVDFTGYSTSVDANKAIYVNIASGSMTINISGGSGVTADAHVRTAGATVTVSASVPVTITVLDDSTGLAIATTARVTILNDSTKAELDSGSVNASGVYSYSYTGSTPLGISGWVREFSLTGTDYIQKDFSGTIDSNGFSSTIRLVPVT